MACRLLVLLAAGPLLVGVFIGLPGCGGTKPPSRKTAEKEADNRNSKSGEREDSRATIGQLPRKLDLNSGAGASAMAFLKGLGAGAAMTEHLSSGFVRAIGLPAELPSEKANGYSTVAAEGWLKRVGGGATFASPAGFAGPDAAVLWAEFHGKGSGGYYFLRLIREGGAWKVDYLAMTSASSAPQSGAGNSADPEYQRFAASAIAGLLCDKDAMPKDERAMALAAGMTPALRARLAEPFSSDKDQGFDYNRGKLLLEAEKIGGGAESYSITQLSPAAEFRLEVVKPGGARAAYRLQLVKGPSPGQWLIDSISPQ